MWVFVCRVNCSTDHAFIYNYECTPDQGIGWYWEYKICYNTFKKIKTITHNNFLFS